MDICKLLVAFGHHRAITKLVHRIDNRNLCAESSKLSFSSFHRLCFRLIQLHKQYLWSVSTKRQPKSSLITKLKHFVSKIMNCNEESTRTFTTIRMKASESWGAYHLSELAESSRKQISCLASRYIPPLFTSPSGDSCILSS